MNERLQALRNKVSLHSRDQAVLKKLRIQKLHDYNEIKDLCQFLLGRLALIHETTVAELYPRFGLDRDD